MNDSVPRPLGDQEGPTFSVVIPTHNRPLLLARALASVAQQTLKDLEVVVIDDGSERPTLPEEFDHYKIPIRMYRNEQTLGPAAARNRGAIRSSGAFIAFLDDDDYWLPDKLAAVRRCLDLNPDIDVVFHPSSWDPPPESLISTCEPLDDPVRWVLLNQFPSPSGVVVRRTVHLEVGFDEAFRAAEDLDYLLRTFEKARVARLQSVLTILANPDRRPSGISIDLRIAGRLAFRAKHAHYFEDPAVAAFFLVRLAHLYRRAGLRSPAIASAARSIVRHPTALGLRALIAAALPQGLALRLARYQ